MKYEKFLRNTAFGALVGTLLSLGLAWGVDSNVSAELKRVYTFVFTAFISLIAATFTLVGVFSNIENQQTQEKFQRQRKLQAARAFLPSALSNMCEICRWGVRYSHDFQAYENNLGRIQFEQESFDRLSLSDEIISVFRDVIELSDNEVVSDRLSGLLREYQVFFARWKSDFSPNAQNNVLINADFRMRTTAWAYLYAISSSLFDYARNETDDVLTNVTEEEISSALNQAGAPGVFTEDFIEEIGLYARTFARRFISKNPGHF